VYRDIEDMTKRAAALGFGGPSPEAKPRKGGGGGDMVTTDMERALRCIRVGILPGSTRSSRKAAYRLIRSRGLKVEGFHRSVTSVKKARETGIRCNFTRFCDFSGRSHLDIFYSLPLHSRNARLLVAVEDRMPGRMRDARRAATRSSTKQRKEMGPVNGNLHIQGVIKVPYVEHPQVVGQYPGTYCKHGPPHFALRVTGTCFPRAT